MTWIFNGTPSLDKQSNHVSIAIVAFLMTFIMLGVVATRFKLCKSIQNFKTELTLLAVAAFCSVMMNCLCVGQTRYGLGLPSKLKPSKDQAKAALLNYIGRPFYLIGIGMFKASLLTGYLHVTARTSRTKFRAVTKLMLAYITLATPVYVLVNLLNCTPIRKGWMGAAVPGHCLQFGATNYVISTFNVIADTITFTLPWFMVSLSTMSTKQRLMFWGAFALGFITTVFSGLRIWGLHFNNSGSGDLVYVVLFGSIELNVGIITACIPFIIPKRKYKSSPSIRLDFIRSARAPEGGPFHSIHPSSSGEQLVGTGSSHSIALSAPDSVKLPGLRHQLSYEVTPFHHV